MTRHEPSTVGNPGVTLCQEWAMRRGEYDDRALVTIPGPRVPVHVTLAAVVAGRGLERALRDVACLWLAPCEIANVTGQPLDVCADCQEIRHG